MDDKKLLQLLEAGLGEEAAAKQIDIAKEVVARQVMVYLEAGILKCEGEKERIDWKAYGKWKKSLQEDAKEKAKKKALEAA